MKWSLAVFLNLNQWRLPFKSKTFSSWQRRPRTATFERPSVFLKVQPFSSQVNWSWGQEGRWEDQLTKTKLVNAEGVCKGRCWTTLTIQDTNDRRINWKIFFFFFSHVPSHLTGTMRTDLWPHCPQWCWRSTQPWPLLFPLSRFSSVITRPYYYLNL